MIPLEEMLSEAYSHKITPSNKDWLRLLASTGQPSFENEVEINKLVDWSTMRAFIRYPPKFNQKRNLLTKLKITLYFCLILFIQNNRNFHGIWFAMQLRLLDK